jgi:hypothetical protein
VVIAFSVGTAFGTLHALSGFTLRVLLVFRKKVVVVILADKPCEQERGVKEANSMKKAGEVYVQCTSSTPLGTETRTTYSSCILNSMYLSQQHVHVRKMTNPPYS